MGLDHLNDIFWKFCEIFLKIWKKIHKKIINFLTQLQVESSCNNFHDSSIQKVWDLNFLNMVSELSYDLWLCRYGWFSTLLPSRRGTCTECPARRALHGVPASPPRETEKSGFLGFFFNFFKIFSKTFYVRISMFWHFLRVFDMNFDEKPPSNHLRTIVEWIGEFLKNPNFSCVVTTQSDYFLDSDFWKSDQILTLLNKYND